MHELHDPNRPGVHETVPDDESHAYKRFKDAEGYGRDSAAGEALGEQAGADVCTREVEEIDGVTDGVTAGRDTLGSADVEVGLGDGCVGLELEGGFDEGNGEAGGEMPFLWLC